MCKCLHLVAVLGSTVIFMFFKHNYVTILESNILKHAKRIYIQWNLTIKVTLRTGPM